MKRLLLLLLLIWGSNCFAQPTSFIIMGQSFELKFRGFKKCENFSYIYRSNRDPNIGSVGIFNYNREPSTIVEKYLADLRGMKVYIIQEDVRSWTIDNLVCDTVEILMDTISINLNTISAKRVKFSSSLFEDIATVGHLYMSNANISTIEYSGLMFSERPIGKNFSLWYDPRISKVDSIIISNCSFITSVTPVNIALPCYIKLEYNTFSSDNVVLDLTRFDFEDNKFADIDIVNDQDNIQKIIANYEYFRLRFPANTQEWEKQRIYRQLLEQQKHLEFARGYQRLDKEYKAFEYTKDKSWLGYMQNFVDKNWWNYGYSRQLVILNSFWIFMFFFALNLLVLYRHFIQIYLPTQFATYERSIEKYNLNKPYEKLKFRLARAPVIFVYTLYLFWGIKLDIERFKLKKPIAFAFLLVEYIAGIVCLAYIANYVITK